MSDTQHQRRRRRLAATREAPPLPGQPQPSQQTESLLLAGEQLRVVYAADDDFRSQDSEDGRSTRLDDTARRGRRRKFVTRHHLEAGAPADGGRADIDRVLEHVRRGVDIEYDEASTSQRSVELRGRERVAGSVPVPSPAARLAAVQGPVRMGTGEHALVVDAKMMHMIQMASSTRDNVRPVAARRGGGRQKQPIRRRHLGVPRQRETLSHKLVTQFVEEDGVNNVTPTQVLDAFVSQLPAPSPDQASLRVRMRAPATLTQQLHTLQPRLQLATTMSKGVTTLRMRVHRVAKEHGKLKCLCRCDNSMGVFEGETALVVTRQASGLDMLGADAEIILNKPWLVLEGRMDGEALPLLLCLGDEGVLAVHSEAVP
jgi:hypothetical protein